MYKNYTTLSSLSLSELKRISEDWDSSDLAVLCFLEVLLVLDVPVLQGLHEDLPQQCSVELGNQDHQLLLWHLNRHKAQYMQTD